MYLNRIRQSRTSFSVVTGGSVRRDRRKRPPRHSDRSAACSCTVTDEAGIKLRFSPSCHLSGRLIVFMASLEVDSYVATNRGRLPSESDSNGISSFTVASFRTAAKRRVFLSDKCGNCELKAPLLSDWFRAESGTDPSRSCESLKPKSCWGGNHSGCRIKMGRRSPQACSYVTFPSASYFLGEKKC